MPGRRMHVICGYRFVRQQGLESVPVEVVETIIDHPHKALHYIRVATEKICAEDPLGSECKLLETGLFGLKMKGVIAHDWRGQKGQRVLRAVLEALWPGSSHLVDLHNALDCIEQGGWQCAFTKDEVLAWVRKVCGLPQPCQGAIKFYYEDR